jgi:hypothetical protein
MLIGDNRLADDRWVFAKASLPKRIADHRDGMSARSAIIFLRKQSSGPGPHAEDVEVITAHQVRGDTLILVAIADVHLYSAASDHA